MAKLLTEVHAAMSDGCDGTDVRLDTDSFGVDVHNHGMQARLACALRRAFPWSAELARGECGDHLCVRWRASDADGSAVRRHVVGRVAAGEPGAAASKAELELRSGAGGGSLLARSYDAAACADPVALVREFLADCVAAGELDATGGPKRQKLLGGAGGAGGAAAGEPPVAAVVLVAGDAAWAELKWAARYADRGALARVLSSAVCGEETGAAAAAAGGGGLHALRPRCEVRVLAAEEAAAHAVLPDDAGEAAPALELGGAARLAQHLATR